MADDCSLQEPFRVLTVEGQVDPKVDPQLPHDVLQRLLREMVLLRRLDEKLSLLQRQGRVSSHTSSAGQEAVPVAATLVARSTDWVFPAFREGGIMLARGFPLRRYLAQVFGTRDDVQRGRQMPGHQSSRDVNQVAWSSCVGTQLTHAVGVAWAARRSGDDMVPLAFLGDGAASSPDFHAAMNFAAVLDAPCVFICQNNQYAISTPASRQTAVASIAAKGRAYAVPAQRVDGNDVLATYAVIDQAVSEARSGGGPQFIEAVTYRLGPHSTSDDPTCYRSEGEVEEWSGRDPLRRFEAYLRCHGLVDDAAMALLESELRSSIDEAVRAVEQQTLPDRASMFDDVFESLPWHLSEQLVELSRTGPRPR